MTVLTLTPLLPHERAQLAEALRLGLRAARHACDCSSGPTAPERGARRGCGACRAVVALRAAQRLLTNHPTRR